MEEKVTLKLIGSVRSSCATVLDIIDELSLEEFLERTVVILACERSIAIIGSYSIDILKNALLEDFELDKVSLVLLRTLSVLGTHVTKNYENPDEEGTYFFIDVTVRKLNELLEKY